MYGKAPDSFLSHIYSLKFRIFYKLLLIRLITNINSTVELKIWKFTLILYNKSWELLPAYFHFKKGEKIKNIIQETKFETLTFKNFWKKWVFPSIRFFSFSSECSFKDNLKISYITSQNMMISNLLLYNRRKKSQNLNESNVKEFFFRDWILTFFVFISIKKGKISKLILFEFLVNWVWVEEFFLTDSLYF